MKVETNLMTVIAVALFVAAGVYGIWAQEVAGAVCLLLAAGLAAMIAAYFGFIARRFDQRPEDNQNADVSDGAGAVGFFSPFSYWPFGVGAAVAVATVGLSYAAWWLVAIGAIMIILAASGLVFEYYIGQKA